MKKILITFGTRPDAIKMCPLVKELQKHDDIQTIVCVSGQHDRMLHQVLEAFGIVPDYDLRIMRKEQSLFDITYGVLNGMRDVLQKEQSDIVLVHGDTSTAFAAALTCFYMKIPVGHVEAGLRTYNLEAPWPEEFNREAIGVIARLHFAPTERAKQNLLCEGKKEESIFVTGNTVIDALKTTVYKGYSHALLEWAKDSRLILMTAHRRESVGDPMREVFKAVRLLIEETEDCKVIYPVHPNPKVKELAEEELGGHERIKLVEPLDVIDFHNFMSRAYLILSDSGGVQEEAPSFGVPVLVLRDTTERPEGVAAGTLKLVGTDKNRIMEECRKLLSDQNEYNKMAMAINPYGDGKASERIVKSLRGFLFG